MEFFPDRTHVWLWMREYRAYLYAGEDGEAIGCCENLGTTRYRAWAAWAVHRLVRDGTDYVLFHSTGYGRYLAHIEDEFHHCQPVQCTYDSPEQDNVLFQAVRAEDGSDDIFISNFTFGNWCHPDDEDTPMRWVVEAIPPRLFPLELPPPIPVNPTQLVPILGGCRRCQLQQPPVMLRRMIHYVLADDQGNFNPLQWRMLQFNGRSVCNLRRDLTNELGEANNVLGITLCVRAGSSGRLTPLVLNLPRNERTMNIVVLTTDSPAAQALVYPNVDGREYENKGFCIGIRLFRKEKGEVSLLQIQRDKNRLCFSALVASEFRKQQVLLLVLVGLMRSADCKRFELAMKFQNLITAGCIV